MSSEKIRVFINKNSSSTIRSRANSVTISSVDISRDLATYKIKGINGNYTVRISGFQTGLINTSCTCPYDWGGICKHQAAALKRLQNLNLPTYDKKGVEINYTSVFELPLNPTDGSLTLRDIRDPKVHDPSRARLSEMIFNTSILTQNKIEANIKAYEKWEYINNNVVIEKDGSKLKLTCDCMQTKNKLCSHQFQVLGELVQFFGTLFFVDAKSLKEKQKIQAGEFGLGTKKFENYLSFNFVDSKFTAIPIVEGITPNLKPENWKTFVTNQLDNEFLTQSKIPSNVFRRDPQLDQNYGMAFGISFFQYPAIDIQVLRGKLNKSRELSTGIERVEEPRALSLVKGIDVAEAERIFTDVKMLDEKKVSNEKRQAFRANGGELIGDSNEDLIPFLNYMFTGLEKVKPYLTKYPTLMMDDQGRYTKKYLLDIHIKYESTILSFVLKEDGEFYNLVAYIEVAGKKERLATKKKDVKRLFTIVDNNYYVHSSTDLSLNLMYFRDNPEVKIFKEDFKSFFNEFIKPLQKKYVIDFEIEDMVQSKEQESEAEIVRKLYISELNNFVIFKPILEYPQGEVELFGMEPLQEFEGDVLMTYQRNEELEEAFKKDFLELHPNFETLEKRQFFYLDYDDMTAGGWFFNAFQKMKETNIEVYGFNELKSFKYSPHKPVVTTSVASGIDWFEVEVNIAFGDNVVSIKELKKAILKKDNYIKLDDGSLGMIPEEWLEKYGKLFRTGKIKNDKLEISKLMFSVVDDLFEDMITTEDIRFEIAEKKQKLLSFEEIEQVKQPEGIKATLRDYQLSGLSWLNFLEEFNWGGCLADDMGLGKTIQVISLLKMIKDKTPEENRYASLVVVPTSLIFNWQDELDKFCPSLTYKVVYGPNREKTIVDFDKYDIILTSYGTLMNDIEIIKDYRFKYAILDESQNIKNPTSKRYKAVRIINATNRLVLTGTPIENNTFDLFAQFNFINPGYLGSPADFKANYSEPIDKNKDQNRAEELQKLVTPFLLRRTKEQVATELPPKVESVMYCEMGAAQRGIYDAYRNKYRDFLMGKIENDGIGKSKMYVLEGLIKLRQICDSPALIPDEDLSDTESVKIKELLKVVTEKTGNHKVLIFSQFVTMLDLIRTELNNHNIEHEYLTGQTRNRQERVDNFQNNDDVRVFLISLKAGGTGLNLTAADYVYIVDPWWNPAVEAQAIDRCYRIGQDKHVFAYKMICKNTIEEKIIEYQLSKKKLAADLIKTDDSFVKGLTKADIGELFS